MPQHPIDAIHGLDDRLVLIRGMDFVTVEDWQISTTRVDTSLPPRGCS